MKNKKLLFTLPLFAFGLVSCGSKTPTELSAKVYIKEKVIERFNVGDIVNKSDIKVEAKYSAGEYETIATDKWTSNFFGDKTSYTFTVNDISEKKSIDVNYGGLKTSVTFEVNFSSVFNAHFEIDGSKTESTSFKVGDEKTIKVVIDGDYKGKEKEWIKEVSYKDESGEDAVKITKLSDYEIKVKAEKEITIGSIAAIFTLNYGLDKTKSIGLSYSVSKQGE